ncbi:MAG: matrixin family metalloprotease [Phycisphaerae bacterium]|nr:matrixin family metalloprotease [Phycisphaerae bacterium]
MTLKKRLRQAARLAVATTVFWVGCCIPGVDPNVPLANAKDAEPNNDVNKAVVLALDASGQISFSGKVSPSGDVDVYDLGPVDPGDRIEVEVRSASSSLDPLVALFDSDLDLINYNDDENYEAAQYDSVVDHVVRHASDHCYVAITNSTYVPGTGSYSATIGVTRGGSVPAARSQAVLLDFDGATVNIPGDRTYNISAFNPALIDSRLAGREAEVIESIKQDMEDLYGAYDVEFYTTLDPFLPDTFSRIVFGGLSTTTFGIAQQIDHYNEDLTDEAIIFTDRWTRPFSLLPTVDAIYTSISNVAAHELGHLLGLEHTADVTDLMDTTGTADTILVPQDFKLGILDDTVFPFGWQDAPELLLDTLGPVVAP